jgi:DNA-3-methyladenine glycosylase II
VKPATKPHYWDDAVGTLAGCDAVLGKLIAAYPGVHIARRGDPFTTLARAIVGQQISVQAAQAVWNRFAKAARGTPDGEALAVRLDAGRVSRMHVATLRRCGFSQGKAEYVRDLARHFATGALDPTHWPAMDDEALIEALINVKGIGRWTAEMFLMFHELRADVLPLGDVGLQNAMARHYNGGAKMAPAAMRALAAAWQPYRSVATWYLWRSLDPIPVEY